MDIFAQAKARADEIAPEPADKPAAAAIAAFGFGLLVTGIFIALEWMGFAVWMSWLGAAAAYAAIAYGDSVLGWSRHKRVFQEALRDLKETSGTSLH